MLVGITVTVTVTVAGFTVSDAVPLEVAKLASPAKLALTPVGYVPALMPERLALEMVAIPDASVVAEPLGVPFKENETVLPETGPSPVRVSVADNVAVPPKAPLATATVSVVGATLTVCTTFPLLVAKLPEPP